MGETNWKTNAAFILVMLPIGILAFGSRWSDRCNDWCNKLNQWTLKFSD